MNIAPPIISALEMKTTRTEWSLDLMLSIKEICDRAGIAFHTFQYWRRESLNLLPKPIGVEKKVIYFDESILERIKFILDHCCPAN